MDLKWFEQDQHTSIGNEIGWEGRQCEEQSQSVPPLMEVLNKGQITVSFMDTLNLTRVTRAFGFFFAVGLAVVGMTGCRSTQPSSKEPTSSVARPERSTFPPGFFEIARINQLLGVAAKNYEFELRPDEVLALKAVGEKNGAPDPGNAFSHEVSFEAFERFKASYPTFEPLNGVRFIDLEVLQPGNRWVPEMIRIGLRVPGYDRFFHFERPNGQRIKFGEIGKISRNAKNRILSAEFWFKDGGVQTLAIDAEIVSKSPGK